MTSRERVRCALNHEMPDRCPVNATFVPELEERLRRELDIDECDLGVALGNDMVKVCAGLEMSFYVSKEPEYTCPWGIRWRNVRNEFGAYTEIVRHPLAGDEATLNDYEIPDPNDPSHYASFIKAKEMYGDRKWLVGSSQISVFEAAWYLRGMTQLMMDMYDNPDYVHALMDKVMEFPMTACLRYIDLGADMVWLGDDVATQQGMLMSLDTWRTFLKPRYARMIETFKARNPEVYVAYHSCGNCMDILDEMVGIGLDVLNPLQPMAIDPCEVKKRYGKNLTLYGGLDIQHLMPQGSPAEVRAQVRLLQERCGNAGGYILSPAHHLQNDTPTENVQAFYQAALRNVGCE